MNTKYEKLKIRHSEVEGKLENAKVIEADMDSIHVFIATSDLHLKEKLRMTREEVIESVRELVSYTKEHYSTIVFSAEDATRSDLDYLIKVNQAAVESGATRINIPDTVGTISPTAYGYIVRKNYEALPKDVRIAVHCHNDSWGIFLNFINNIMCQPTIAAVFPE